MDIRVKTSKSWQPRGLHFFIWLALLAVFILFMRAVEPILLPFVLGLLFAYVLDPLATRMSRRRMSRTVAASLLVVVLCTVITGLMMWLVPLLYEQLINLFSRAPAMLSSIEKSLRSEIAPLVKSLNKMAASSGNPIPTDPGALIERSFQSLEGVPQRLLASGAAFVNVMAMLLITPIVCFYLIRDWPVMVRKIEQLLPRFYAPTILQQIHLINLTLSGYLRGQMIVMLLLSAFYMVAFTVLGLNFGLVLGLLAGCIVIIPYIGTLISIGLGLIVAHGQFGFEGDFWTVLVVYAIGQFLEAQVLVPKIIGDRVGLHPLWMLFGMLAGGAILGFVGVLLAVPLTAVIGVLVKFAVARYLQSSLYYDA